MIFIPIMSALIGSEVNRTPPSLSPPAGVQALKPASSDLPLKSHTAEDKQLNKVLSPDQVQSLKAEVTDALGDMNKTKKGGISATKEAGFVEWFETILNIYLWTSYIETILPLMKMVSELVPKSVPKPLSYI